MTMKNKFDYESLNAKVVKWSEKALKICKERLEEDRPEKAEALLLAGRLRILQDDSEQQKHSTHDSII